MAMRFCTTCGRNVNAQRRFGIGTLILVLITGGIWILFMPFYAKQCPICRSYDGLERIK